MKFMKKTLAVVLAITMLVLAVPFTASAADEPTITVSTAQAEAGQTVDVTIDISGNPGIVAMLFKVDYDEDLTLTSIKNGTVLNGPQHNPNGLDKNPYTVNFADDTAYENNTNNGTIITLSFQVAEGAEVGLAPVTVSYEKGNAAIYDVDFNDVDFDIVNGGVKVLGKDFEGLSFNDKTVTYNSGIQNVAVTGVPENVNATVAYTVNGKAFRGTEDAGTYEVTATVTAPGYNEWTDTATLKINPATVTVNAVVADKVYDGTNAVTGLVGTPSIEGYIEGDDLSINPASLATVKFASKDIGTHAIEHEIEVIGSDKDNYEYTINVPKASITKRPATIKAENKTVKVGEALPALTAVVEGAVEGETLDYTVTTTAKNTNTVRNYPITVKADATKNPNYEITVTNGVLSVIDKTEQNVTVAEVADVTYGDEGFKLKVTEVDGTDAAVVYKAETANVSVDAEGNVEILGAGTAKITVSKAGDADYADFSETVTFTVNKKDVTVTADNKTATKGGELPELTYQVEGLVDGDELTVTLTTSARNTNTVKDYPITVKVASNANYNVTTVNGILSVIDKIPQEITVTSNLPSDITYGDEGFKIDVAYGNTVTEAETVFASDNEEVATVDAQGNVTIVGAGEAVITVSKAGNDTIADFKEEIEVVVAKKAITITANDASKKVGAADPDLSYVVTGTLVGNDAFSGNVSREEGEEVGTYIIGPGTLSITNSKNYDVNFIGGTFTIFDKTPQDIVVASVYEKTYGDEGFKLDVQYGESNVSSEVTTFVSDNENVAAVDAEGNVAIVGAGTAKITVAKKGNADLADFTKTVTVTVAKKQIKVIADAKEKYVGEETPALTYTLEGELVGNDEFTGELTVADKDVAGRSYDIKIGTLALNDNYKVTFVGAKLKVLAKLDQDITLGELEDVTYGDAGAVLEVTKGEYNTDAAVVFASDNEEVATVDAEGNITIVGAGEAEITVTVAGNNKYNDYEDSVTLTVAKKAVKVTADNLTKKIGTADPELTYTPDVELVAGDAFTGTLEREAGEDLGTYDILQGTLALSDNYKLTFVKGTLTIVDKNPQTVTVDGIPETATYGDDSFAITAESAEIPGTAVEYTSSNEEVITIDDEGNALIVGAGEAVIEVKLAGNDDYAEAVVTKTVVVAPKEIVIEELDLVNKTVVFEGMLAIDAAALSIDFAKLTLVLEEVEEGQTPANYVVTGFELTGDASAKYVLATESVLVPISDEIELATVTVTCENGAVEGAGSYLSGSEVTLVAIPDRNYKFAGWFVGEEKVSSDAEYTFTLDADIELTAKFAKKSTGGVGGGSTPTPTRVVYFQIEEDNIEAVTVKKGSKVAKPEDPTLDGFKFEGWFADAEFTAEFDFDTVIEDSVTVYAKWTEVEKEPGEGDDGKTEDPVEWKNNYNDVDENDWFYETVKSASVMGIMNGMSENEFGPYEHLTRAMLVTILYRADGEAEVSGDVTFKDVNLDAYYGDALIWATENGIVNGYSETKFAPDAKITREQIATIMLRYAVYKGVEAVDLSENLSFKDADEISQYAVSSMNWAVGQGIITGYENNTIKPKNNATRAEVATIVVRFLAKIG